MENLINKKVNEIYSVISNKKNKRYSLLGDGAGELLFLYHYAKYKKDNRSREVFEQRLEHFLLNFQNTEAFSLCNGLMGNVWLLQYFINEGIIDDLLLDIKEDLNHKFIELSEYLNNLNDYDYLHGLLGVVYCSAYTEVIVQSNIQQALIKFITTLKKDGDFYYVTDWMNFASKENTYDEVINLGLAHGLPSVVSVLSKLKNNKEYLPYVIGIINLILKSKKSSNNECLFGSVLYDRKLLNKNSRLAWCYGDLGIACMFWNAGIAFNIKDWELEAIDIILHSCNRRDLIETSVSDAGICHGTAGIAHIFHRFYLRTKNEKINDAANYWFNETIKMAKFEDGVAGYKSWQNKQGWVNEIGLLEGITGIGLVLLDLLSDDETNLDWDSCLLIS
ncbi:MAG: Lanthionine synthetase family protein [Bacteroidetes bacterium]|jgi:hypothetical protein|nr:Lanthionine synthetase family protein [Bacteroidota bacterium]